MGLEEITFKEVSITRPTELHKSKQVMNSVSYSWFRGEICAIIGPSGSGKSTLLRLINRLIEPDSGRIYFKMRDIGEIPVLELRQKVGMVFQSPVLFPGTVEENICCGPKLRGENLPNSHEYLAMVGLEEGMNKRDVAQLSGGEKQRVAIARALANKPEVLLLDEPTSALDPQSTELIETLIVQQQQCLNLTVLWVTHNLEQAKRIANRTILLENGFIREI